MRDYKRYTSAPIYGKTWQLIVKLLRHTGRRTRSAYLLFCYKNTANSQNLAKTRSKIWFRKNHCQDIKIDYPGAYQKTCIIHRKFLKIKKLSCRCGNFKGRGVWKLFTDSLRNVGFFQYTNQIIKHIYHTSTKQTEKVRHNLFGLNIHKVIKTKSVNMAKFVSKAFVKKIII